MHRLGIPDTTNITPESKAKNGFSHLLMPFLKQNAKAIIVNTTLNTSIPLVIPVSDSAKFTNLFHVIGIISRKYFIVSDSEDSEQVGAIVDNTTYSRRGFDSRAS